MTATQTIKQYGETVVASSRSVAERLAETYKTSVLATVGASDLAVERTRTAVKEFRSRAVALPGEAQVQADLAAKEARTRATEAVGRARTSAQELAVSLRPETVASTVAGLVLTAGTRATSRLEELAERGEHVVDELRRQPGFRRLIRGAEGAVDAIEDRLEDALEDTGKAVTEASNEVTSLTQKAAAKTTKAVDKAEARTRSAARSAKSTVEAAEPKPAKPAKASTVAKNRVNSAANTGAKRTTPAAEKAPAKAATARVTRARTARRSDPTAVPAKKNR
jgi:heparin binding hemagglutinin HbhA